MANAADNYWRSLSDPRRKAELRAIEDELRLRDVQARCRRKDWCDCAHICWTALDRSLLCDDRDDAAEYARLGAHYAREALAQSDIAVGRLRSVPESDLRATMFLVVHACDWHIVGKEDERLIHSALSYLRPFAESTLRRLGRQHVRARIRFAAVTGLMAGDPQFAQAVTHRVTDFLRRERTTDVSVIFNEDLLLLLLADYLAAPHENAHLRTPAVEAMKFLFGTWNKGTGIGNLDLTFAIFVSYIAAKWFEELRTRSFTREEVVRRLRSGGVV